MILFLNKISDDQINVPGNRDVLFVIPQKKSENTGQYTCRVLYDDGRILTKSWYIYFYPGDGELFLKCGLTANEKCLVFYRLKVPFDIPCKALHPDINVKPKIVNIILLKSIDYVVLFF